MRLVKYWIRPLCLSELEANKPEPEDVSDGHILRVLGPAEGGLAIEILRGRYCQVRDLCERLFTVPGDEQFLSKIVWPLRSAVVSFVSMNLLGCVALCGVVAEMVALLNFKISEVKVNGRDLTTELQADLWGREFEKLGQEARVGGLRALGIIDEEMEKHFGKIRDVRRKYLHFLSKGHEDIEANALVCLQGCVELLTKTIGQGVRDGALIFTPAFARHLTRIGLLQD